MTYQIENYKIIENAYNLQKKGFLMEFDGQSFIFNILIKINFGKPITDLMVDA